MKKMLVTGAIWAALVFMFSSTSQGDAPAEVTGGGDGNGNGQNLHGHRGMRDASRNVPTGPPRPQPFELTDPGPAGALWSYDALTGEEKAQVDRNRDTTSWNAVNDAYASVVAEQANAAIARSAALQLGVGDLGLDQEGVVP